MTCLRCFDPVLQRYRRLVPMTDHWVDALDGLVTGLDQPFERDVSFGPVFDLLIFFCLLPFGLGFLVVAGRAQPGFSRLALSRANSAVDVLEAFQCGFFHFLLRAPFPIITGTVPFF